MPPCGVLRNDQPFPSRTTAELCHEHATFRKADCGHPGDSLRSSCARSLIERVLHASEGAGIGSLMKKGRRADQIACLLQPS